VHKSDAERLGRFEQGGVSSQLLRYIEILLLSPWKVELEENGYALSPKRTAQIANPTSFLAQKIPASSGPRISFAIPGDWNCREHQGS
jgi:hypothetical protein